MTNRPFLDYGWASWYRNWIAIPGPVFSISQLGSFTCAVMFVGPDQVSPLSVLNW